MLSIKQIWKYLLAIVLTLTVALAAAGCGSFVLCGFEGEEQ